MEAHIRWMKSCDLPEFMDIERRVFEFPWSESEAKSYLANRDVIALVAVVDGMVVGFIVYELNRTYYWLMNVAVHPEWQGIGIGSQMLGKLKSKLNQERRTTIRLVVREKNLLAQLWLAKNGFHATGIVHNKFAEVEEDVLRFTYRIQNGVLATGVA